MRLRWLILPATVGMSTALLACWSMQPWVRSLPPIASPLSVDTARLRKHVETIVAIHPRDFGSPDKLDRVAAYIQRSFVEMGLTPVEQTWTVTGDTYRNLIVRLGPDDGEVVVVGAHYDACGDTRGADDNASGVAGLLELARLLKNEKLASPVELAAYSLEEPPNFRTNNMGSVHHARALKQRGAHVRAMISVEMIGFFSDEPDSQGYPLELLGMAFPSTGNFISVVSTLGDAMLARHIKAAMAGASSLPVISMGGPRLIPGVEFSDHLAFLDEDWPAVMVTDTAFNRNPNYHALSDTPDTLDFSRMAQVVEGVRQATLMLAAPTGD